jgi:hypothetical protein
MTPKPPVLWLLALFLSLPALLYAQNNVAVPDTGKTKRIADSVFKSMGFVKTPTGALKSIKGAPANSLTNGSQALNSAGEKVNQLKSNFSKGLGAHSAKSVMFNLVAGSNSRLNPFPAFSGLNNNSKFQNIFSLRGNVLAFGIPFTLDLSTDHSPVAQQFNRSSLFKFDFDSKQYNSLFRSDLENYYNLRRSAFNGLDLTAYTHNLLTEQLAASKNLAAQSSKTSALTNYINDPDKLNELLTLNKQQITGKLRSELGTQNLPVPKPDGLIPAVGFNTTINPAVIAGSVNTKMKEATLSDLSRNQEMGRYLNDPGNISQLKNLNEQQLASKLNGLQKNESLSVNFLLDGTGYQAWYAEWLSAFLSRVSEQQLQVKQEITNKTAHDLFISLRQTNSSQFSSIISDQQKALAGLKTNNAVPGADSVKAIPDIKIDTALSAGIDSVATSITSVTSALQKRGYDVRKMLQMQHLLNDNNFDASSSEFINGILAKKPANGFQSLFSGIGAFKAGSYGNIMPASTQNQELFVSGTHITVNSNSVPITLGFGSISDINSAKDAGFQSSVYNQPRNITYIGAQLSKTFKVSAISSFNHQVRTDLYTIPTISTNNVAFTLSKALSVGAAGNLGLDISKSTTLYNSRFQVGNEAVLEKLGGLNYNDMFATLSVGVNHHLDIKGLDASDNVYFNYAGMGYQNPGNNGFGGGRMKYGGNIRKSFMQHKLIFNLRSDLTAIPISYTTNDRWKTYQVQLESRYTFSRKFNMSFKYTDNGTDKRVDNISSPVYTMRKLQFDGNTNYKIGKYFSASHFTIGQQSFSNPATALGDGNLLMINYTQSIVMKSNSLTASVFYNKEMSAYRLIGNMLNSDITYQYMLFGKLSLASAITYLDNDKLANQVGVRQGIQLFSVSNFEVDSYVDVRKNLIKPVYPDLYASYRAELSLKYHLKN